MAESADRGRGDVVSGDVADELVWGSLVPFVRSVLRHPRIVLTLAIGFPAAAIAIHFLQGPRFEASSSFTPESTDQGASSLINLAQQFGFPVPGASSIGDPVRFYEELLASRDLIRTTLHTTYRFTDPESGEALEGTYLDLYEIREDTPEETERRALDRLRDDISVSSSRDAGIVHVTTTARWPPLAEALNERLLELVSEFNMERRQSQAGAERRFIEERLQSAESELEGAEERLADFLRSNRAIEGSPDLQAERDRLQRVVTHRLQVFTQLAQGFEQARIDEVRDTPVITIVESPSGSARPEGGLVLDVLLWLILGTFTGITLAVVQDSLARHRRRDPNAHQELAQLRRTIVWRLVRPGRAAFGPDGPGSAGDGPVSSARSLTGGTHDGG